MEKWLIYGLWQRKQKISLEHAEVPKLRKCSKEDEDMSKGHKNQAERVSSG